MAASAASFFNSNPRSTNKSHPFLHSWLRTNRASHPSGSSDQPCSAFALAVFTAPEDCWCRFASNCCCTDSWLSSPMPTPCWLALQAIRFVARATAYDIPFRLMALRQTPYSGLAVTVATLLFECKSIPLYFMSASCWLKKVRKLTLTPPPPAVGGRLDDFQVELTSERS
jgi:hypothetical protein